jgi:hypothetical protein
MISVTLHHAVNRYDVPIKTALKLGGVITISENDYVFFDIQSDEPLNDECYLWLSDFRFKVNFSNYFESVYYYIINLNEFFKQEDIIKFSYRFNILNQSTLFYKIFLNYYGECNIEIEGLSSKEQIIVLGKINVESNKIQNINLLLDYLLEKNHFYWSSVSLTKIEASDVLKDQENIIWILKKIEKSLGVLNDQFLPHIKDPIARLVPEYSVNAYNENSNVTEESLLWLLENPNSLENTYVQDENNLLILNRQYKLHELLVQNLIDNTDVLENQVIHGFINDLSNFVGTSLQAINKVLDNISSLNDFKSQIYKSYYKRLQETIKSLQLSLYYINNMINEYIPVKRVHMSFTDKSRFQSKQHYYDVYLEISKWISRREAVYSIDELFSGAKDIAKLYEVFCLFKIIDSLTEDLGYSMDKFENPISQNEELYELNSLGHNSLHSNYIFTDKSGSVKIKLYYETLPSAITTVAKGIARGYRPDFILEVNEENYSPKYIIMDAKYKKLDNIKAYDYQELTLKYLHGIGLVGGGYLPVIGLFILNPILDSGIDYYQKNYYTTSKHLLALPLIGSVEVALTQKRTNYLKEIFLKAMDFKNSY